MDVARRPLRLDQQGVGALLAGQLGFLAAGISLTFGVGQDSATLLTSVRGVGCQALARPEQPHQDREGGSAVQHESEHFDVGPLAHEVDSTVARTRA